MDRPTRAEFVVSVPPAAKNWSGDDAQKWARHEILHGGPPDKPLDPRTGEALDWNDLRNRVGEKVRILARPMGLIFSMPDGSKQFFAGDATSSHGKGGVSLGMSTAEVRKQAETERAIRKFATEEVARYNKKEVAKIREEQGRTATREFWEAGQRIRTFLAANHSRITQDQVWYSLEQWGRGADGYGKNWFEDATYFFDWRPNARPDDSAFAVSETRIMNIRRATKDVAGRDRLLKSCLVGLLAALRVSDEEFKWITGQSISTFPLDPETLNELKSLGQDLVRGAEHPQDADALAKVLARVRSAPGPKRARTAPDEQTPGT